MWEYNELQHHGIKGMRWGVRRTKAQLGYSTTPSKTRKIKKTKKQSQKQARKEAVSKMSDQELRNRINRIQMERQYMQLTSAEMSPGKKFVKDVVTNAAKQTVTNYTAKYMTKGMEALLNQAKK